MKNESVERLLNSIEFFLNPKVFGSDKLTKEISERLTRGDLIIVRKAMAAPFAERMFSCLDQFSQWQAFDGYEEHFHYHHHNIYDDTLFPPDLNWCRDIFRSGPTKDYIQRLSGLDCQGEATVTASLYLPGDHSLPHNDSLGHQGAYRQIAFVWYLTRNWQPEWGGDFFWCPKSRFISPSFNTLIMFAVRPDNTHFVTHVSPYARSKRLAISGWWTSKEIPNVPHSDSKPIRTAAKKSLLEII